ncbi:hypothetical protein ANCCEY_09194 [Ancylostoma ceylanicum]|uniref:Uncharacterized protein n=1 Tax=Ancylostoma ceylanicum TaxID=53326 RepID=A0A0D6LVQ4_9BILA|nr:hypothetical protein ANCCEY_09194 [Ancylostoma ceylanicum]
MEKSFPMRFLSNLWFQVAFPNRLLPTRIQEMRVLKLKHWIHSLDMALFLVLPKPPATNLDFRLYKRYQGKIYRTVVRPATMYGSECWPVSKTHETMLNTAEMRMLRWAYGLTRRDQVRGKRPRGAPKKTMEGHRKQGYEGVWCHQG